MAIIQINAPSVNKATQKFVEGNNRRKFLVTTVQFDDGTIQPAFADNVKRSTSTWIPTKAFDAQGNESNPADEITKALANLKKAGKGERLHLHAVIRNLTMQEPVMGENDIVYQDLTVTIDDSAPKRVITVAPAPWSIEVGNL